MTDFMYFTRSRFLVYGNTVTFFSSDCCPTKNVKINPIVNTFFFINYFPKKIIDASPFKSEVGWI